MSSANDKLMVYRDVMGVIERFLQNMLLSRKNKKEFLYVDDKKKIETYAKCYIGAV